MKLELTVKHLPDRQTLLELRVSGLLPWAIAKSDRTLVRRFQVRLERLCATLVGALAMLLRFDAASALEAIVTRRGDDDRHVASCDDEITMETLSPGQQASLEARLLSFCEEALHERLEVTTHTQLVDEEG